MNSEVDTRRSSHIRFYCFFRTCLPHCSYVFIEFMLYVIWFAVWLSNQKYFYELGGMYLTSKMNDEATVFPKFG